MRGRRPCHLFSQLRLQKMLKCLQWDTKFIFVTHRMSGQIKDFHKKSASNLLLFWTFLNLNLNNGISCVPISKENNLRTSTIFQNSESLLAIKKWNRPSILPTDWNIWSYSRRKTHSTYIYNAISCRSFSSCKTQW